MASAQAKRPRIWPEHELESVTESSSARSSAQRLAAMDLAQASVVRGMSSSSSLNNLHFKGTCCAYIFSPCMPIIDF